MEPIRISARPQEAGKMDIEAYDAEALFSSATERLNEGRCEEAVPRYDRLVDEFPSSKFASPALYNAGLCLMRLERLQDAVERFEHLTREMPDSPDVRDARFLLAKLYVELERWNDAIGAADRLMEREDLSPDLRVEAMARRAQGLLGLDELEEARAQGRAALGYAHSRPEGKGVRGDFFLSVANFVVAETIRKRAARIVIPEADMEAQRAVLERRARLILDAQREYFATIRKSDAKWASAAGYRIGQMYDRFWEAIMDAPVPPPETAKSDAERKIYREEYRRELARLIKPLIRHSIRYWELTLMMIERTGVETEWKKRIREDLERARERLLEQPEGEGGLPAT